MNARLALVLVAAACAAEPRQCPSSARLQCAPAPAASPIIVTNGCARRHSDAFWHCIGEAGAAP